MRRKSFSQRLCRLLHETIVFFFHNSIGYAIMLSVMMYSGWLFLSVILGMGLGYFLFGHITMKVNMENINVRKTAVVCPPSCPEAGTSGMGNLNFFKFIQFTMFYVDHYIFFFQQVNLHRLVQRIRVIYINHKPLPISHQIHAMKIK